MKSILVTGGAGFIGSHLVDRLLIEGYQVKVVDSLVPQVHGAGATRPRFLAADAVFEQADLCDASKWEHLLDDVDAVVHLAAEVGVGQSMYEIVRYVRGNSFATAVLLQTLLSRRDRVQKLVVASSMSIYGEGAYHCPNCGVSYPRLRSSEQLQLREWEMRCGTCGGLLRPLPTREDKPLYPSSIYAVTKRDHEEMCLTFGTAYEIPTVALRFFNVYGPRQALANPYTGVGAIFCSRLLNGKSPLVFEDGLQSRDFVHVSDIVEALVLSLRSKDVQNDVFNVGTGRALTILDMVNGLCRSMEIQVDPEIVNSFRAGDIRHCFADIDKITGSLGYRPRVSFEDGVRDLVASVRGEVVVDRADEAFRELERHHLAW